MDFVIFLPRVSPINVNTASAEVLSARVGALTLSDATDLVESRKSASFRDLADFSNRLQGKPFSATNDKVSVTTNYFLVNGKVRISRAELGMQTLIERNGNNTKLIWVKEY